jgi:hypothetical protein
VQHRGDDIPGDTQDRANVPVDDEGKRSGPGAGNRQGNVYSRDAINYQTFHALRAGARSRRQVEVHESLFFGGELLCLVFLLEGIEQLVELPIHHFLQLVQREVDPVVGYAALREVVRTDTL